MKLLIVILLLPLTACDFPKRGDQIKYVSYEDAFEVASRECQSLPQFANNSLYDCLNTMDFHSDIENNEEKEVDSPSLPF